MPSDFVKTIVSQSLNLPTFLTSSAIKLKGNNIKIALIIILLIMGMDLDIIFEHCLYFLKFPQKD